MDAAAYDRDTAAAILEVGWRTGCACPPEFIDWHGKWMPRWLMETVRESPEYLWVPFVCSQGCDLVCGKLADEPFVEFILGRLQMPQDPGIALTRSYRRLQLPHQMPFAEFRASHRWLVDRRNLLDLPRAERFDLGWETGIQLGKWIGGKYSRYPLPNALVKRMPLTDAKRRDWLKKLNAEVAEIRILVTPPDLELADGVNYNIVLYVIAKQTLSSKANESYDKLKKWLQDLPGITAQVHLVSGDKFSYATFHETHRVDLDDLTYGYFDGPRGAVSLDH